MADGYEPPIEPALWESDEKLVAVAKAIAYFDAALRTGELPYWVSDVRRELAGKNLVCWCPIGSPCHADVLLRVANGGEP
jgi:hypothetical protein